MGRKEGGLKRGPTYSKVAGLAAVVAAAAGGVAAESEGRAVGLDVAETLAVVALLGLGGARQRAAVGLVAGLLAVVAQALGRRADLGVVANIATLVAGAAGEGRHFGGSETMAMVSERGHEQDVCVRACVRACACVQARPRGLARVPVCLLPPSSELRARPGDAVPARGAPAALASVQAEREARGSGDEAAPTLKAVWPRDDGRLRVHGSDAAHGRAEMS